MISKNSFDGYQLGKVEPYPHQPQVTEETPIEMLCSTCKWGVAILDDNKYFICHLWPSYNCNPQDYWCSKWEKRT
jgi:hypothetical protein